MNTPINRSSANDFDFFIGSWHVAHRRLKHRLADCDEWVAFEGSTVVQKVLGGLGNMDDNILDLPGDAYRALSLRSFNPDTRQWSIWWLDGRHPGSLDTPVVGSFDNKVGTFYADDTLGEKQILVSFLWTHPQPDRPRWEQAFSADAGKTWEVNWSMDFTRTA